MEQIPLEEEEEQRHEEDKEGVTQITAYPLRTQQSPLIVRQLPSHGLSFQVWPAASALCSFLEELFGQTGMYQSEVRRLDLCPDLAFQPHCSVDGFGTSACRFRDYSDLCHTEAQQNGETLALSSSCGEPHDGVAFLNQSERRKVRVLELGAGTGMVGILSALLGAEATITDLPHVVPNLLHNASLNEEALRGSGGGKVNVKALRWGEQVDMQAIGRSFDLILASDVVYYDYLFEPLLRTLKWLLLGDEQNCSSLRAEPHEGVSPVVLLAHLRRWKKDAQFFRKASKLFNVRTVHRHSHENSRTGVTVYCFTSKNCT